MRIPRKKGEPWQDPHNSPHCTQCVINRDNFPYERVIDPPFRRLVTDASPTETYHPQPEYIKTVLHWGQRKLLMSEIEFLTLVGEQDLTGATVVYAGAAPGHHVPCLLRLFPNVHYILLDPTPFSQCLVELERRPNSNVMLMNTYLTDELAGELSKRYDKILFISDIRVDGHSEESIQKDMADQARWHELMKSTRSILKFRLPWYILETTEYLDGDLHLPVWGPQTTTESRLITKKGHPLARHTYDNDRYNNQMFYHRCYTRPALYPHAIEGVPGLDHCYDCTAEVDILRRYLAEFGPRMRDPAATNRAIADLSNEITRNMPGGRTLGTAVGTWRARANLQKPSHTPPPEEPAAKRRRTDDTTQAEDTSEQPDQTHIPS